MEIANKEPPLRSLDTDERARKKAAREGHKHSKDAQNLRGIRAKLSHERNRKEKIQMRKKIKAHEERNIQTAGAADPANPVPQYLLDRSAPTVAKGLSSAIKERRKEKAARFSVPLPKVRGISEEEMFRVVKTGKTKHKGWKRMLTKPTFVGPDFTRRPVKYERFIRYELPLAAFAVKLPCLCLCLFLIVENRPMGLRHKKANVTHPTLAVTVLLPILSVKKNPQGTLYTQLGVLTKGAVIEVNVSELGLTTASGKVVWGKWAQITSESCRRESCYPTPRLLTLFVLDNPENDGCVNA